MSGIGGLSGPIIVALLRNLGLDPITQTALGNFLRGRKRTVTNPDEFTRGARSIIRDTEAVGGLETGSVIGEVIGALEGGLIVGKVAEIVSGLQDLLRGGPAEDAARSNGRARGDGGGKGWRQGHIRPGGRQECGYAGRRARAVCGGCSRSCQVVSREIGTLASGVSGRAGYVAPYAASGP